eukprot:4051218-Pleurochrysis_carterae.AAC.3
MLRASSEAVEMSPKERAREAAGALGPTAVGSTAALEMRTAWAAVSTHSKARAAARLALKTESPADAGRSKGREPGGEAPCAARATTGGRVVVRLSKRCFGKTLAQRTADPLAIGRKQSSEGAVKSYACVRALQREQAKAAGFKLSAVCNATLAFVSCESLVGAA